MIFVFTRVADPGGLYPDPDPTFEKKSYPEPIFKNQTVPDLDLRKTWFRMLFESGPSLQVKP